MLGFGMLIPDIQLRAEAMGAPGWQIGAILASTFLVQAVVSPMWGRVADVRGHKQILAICSLLSAASMALYAFANLPILMLGSRVLAGFGAANVAMAFALTSTTVGEDQRPTALGRLSASMTLGLIAGPALGGFMAHAFGQITLGLVAAGASLLGLSLVFLLPTAPVYHQEAEAEETTESSPMFHRLLMIATIGWFALATLEGTFGRLIKARLGMGTQEFGIIFGWESLVAFAVQTFAVAYFIKLGKLNKVLAAAFVLTGFGLALMPYAGSMLHLLLLGSIFAVGTGASTPLLNELAAELSSARSRGQVYGTLQAARSAGFIIGPVLGGFMFDLKPSLPYLAAAAACVVAALLSLRLNRPS
jgi:MFS family permease